MPTGMYDQRMVKDIQHKTQGEELRVGSIGIRHLKNKSRQYYG